MIGQSATGQAHGDKTGQGRGLEKPAIARLDLLEYLQRFSRAAFRSTRVKGFTKADVDGGIGRWQ